MKYETIGDLESVTEQLPDSKYWGANIQKGNRDMVAVFPGGSDADEKTLAMTVEIAILLELERIANALEKVKK